MRAANGHFLPGASGNPSGRPTTKVSMLRLLEDRLTDDATPKAIIEALIDKCIKERDIPAIREVFDRIDGKVPSEVSIRALIVNVGDDYAREGIEAVKRDLLERQERYLLEETHQG